MLSYFRGLFTNIRFYILFFSAILAGSIYFYIKQTIPSEGAQISELTQGYALVAVTYLYLALLASPFTRFFTFVPFRGKYLYARRAIGVSAWLFAGLHVYYGFFGELGGFEGLQFLNLRYLSAVSLGAVSISILSLMALTSFDWMIAKLSYVKWKLLHKLVYLAALLTTIHALMLGSHFTNFSGRIPQLFSVALVFLLILESIRFDIYLSLRFPALPKIGVSFVVTLIGIVAFSVFAFIPSQFSANISVHEQHKKIAVEAQKTDLPDYLKNTPGMQGDKTKRFTVDWDYAEPVEAGKEIGLKFRVFDASNGQPVELFSKNYEKLMHLIIVDSSLNFYQHVHPEYKDGWFEVKTTLPSEGRYNLYLDFVPAGAIEQQIGLSLHTSNQTTDLKFAGGVDESLSKQCGDYIVNLKFDAPLKASLLSVGGQNLKYEILNNQKQPVTTLKPYLGSYGHLVMINTQTYEYIHVHPVQTGSLLPDQSGGPVVVFMPVGIYGPIKPGIYRLFAQLNPDNNLITSMFTVRVE